MMQTKQVQETSRYVASEEPVWEAGVSMNDGKEREDWVGKDGKKENCRREIVSLNGGSGKEKKRANGRLKKRDV